MIESNRTRFTCWALLGFYVLQGFEADCTVLRELVTGVECRAVVPSGHRGDKGELCLVRVPPPLPGGSPHVVFTTPYVILRPGPEEWLAYFARCSGPEIDPGNHRTAGPIRE